MEQLSQRALDDPLSTVLRLSSDLIWIVDAAGALVQFNEQFHRAITLVSGRSPRLGDTVARLFEEERQADLRVFWENLHYRVLAGREVQADFSWAIDRVKRVYFVSACPMAEGRSGAILLAREITESRLRKWSEGIELGLARIFAEDDALPAKLTRAIALVCTGERWDAGIVWLAAGDPPVLRPAASWYALAGDLFDDEVHDLAFIPGRGVPGRAFSSREVIWVADLLEETGLERAGLVRDLGIHAVLGAPIVGEGGALGVIELFARAVRPANEEFSELLREAGTKLGRFIDRQRAEDERTELLRLVQTRSREWQLTFDAIESPIVLFAPDATIVRMNRAAAALLPGDPADAIGRPLEAAAPFEPWRTVADVVGAVRDSGVACSAELNEGESGRHWDVAATSYRSAESGDDRIIVTLRDVTTLVNLQEFVRRGEQLAALGELVAGVAHEVRNPLFGIGAALDVYQPSFASHPDAEELFGSLRVWLGRLNRLMENLLEYGKSWKLNLVEGDFSEVLAQSVASSASLYANDAGVEIATSTPGPLILLMDSSRMLHALENVITNAVQYSQRGGRVTVEATKETGPEGDMVRCTVRDRGPGFREEDLSRLFEPFFTRRRGGTGLGLSIVQRVVEEHGGTLSAFNAEEGGGIVQLSFPLFRVES